MSRGGFGVCPNWLIDDQTIDRNVMVLYLILTRFTDRSNECFPSQTLLAEKMGKSVETVKRTLRKMRDLGLIESWAETTPTGRRNRYRLLMVPGGVGSPATRPIGSPQAQEQEPVEQELLPATKPAASEQGRRSAQPLVAAWVDGHDETPPNQSIRKFSGHARDLTNELRHRHGTLTDVPDQDWQRALDTATMLGVTNRFGLIAAYYGENGHPPLLPPDGHYTISEGAAYTW